MHAPMLFYWVELSKNGSISNHKEQQQQLAMIHHRVYHGPCRLRVGDLHGSNTNVEESYSSTGFSKKKDETPTSNNSMDMGVQFSSQEKQVCFDDDKKKRREFLRHAMMSHKISSLFISIGMFLLLLGMWLGTNMGQQDIEGHLRRIGLVENYVDILLDFHPSLPFNSKYTVPGSHPQVGDRSTRYVLHRKKYDESTPDNMERSLKFAQNLHINTFDTFPFESHHHSDQVVNDNYDIYNCPHVPPNGYPFSWNAKDVLNHWPTDDITPRPAIYQSLCVFDYQKDYKKAMTYRDLELPFVVKNDPNIAKSVERWNSPGYIEGLLGDIKHRTEYSENNHFLYSVPLPERVLKGGQASLENFRKRFKLPKNWKPSTKQIHMTFRKWLSHANVTTVDQKQQQLRVGPNDPHWYFRLIGCGIMSKRGHHCDNVIPSSEYLFDELPFFQPNANLYVREPSEQKGIHCRFGMDGVIAENHFDGSRNTIVVLKGSRRYLLSHPNQCDNLALYPPSHPSGRHSQVDWSNPNDWEKYPKFKNNAKINEVVLQSGDAMYLPTHWFHYIISLELNFQCNTRSGIGHEYSLPIQQCGFHTP